MGAERVSWGWNSSALFPKYKCIGNRAMKSPLRLALVDPYEYLCHMMELIISSWRGTYYNLFNLVDTVVNCTSSIVCAVPF
jgi:hypothetical protein